MTTLFERALHGRVAARMAALFILCSSVPLIVLALLTVHQTSRSLESRERQRLQAEARSVAQDGLGRLDLLSRSLALYVHSVGSLPNDATADPQRRSLATTLLPLVPKQLTVTTPDGGRLVVFGPPLSSSFEPEQQTHLDRWGRLLRPVSGTDSWILVVTSADSPASRAEMSIDMRWIFRLDDEDTLPADAVVCVTPPASPSACSEGVSPQVAQATRGDRDATAEDESGVSLVRNWELTLKAEYDAPPLTITLIRPQAVVRAPLREFALTFSLVVIVAGLAATWLAVTQVRSQMQPLGALTAATERLARRDFGTPVVVRTNDEFAVLARAFNTLSADLERQFEALDAFNLGTLAALARAIDAKSPWTRGHSERVTNVAVAIAAAMQLPETTIEELRRGGLVHDIGKLATPPEILDKAGPLTEEEAAIMRKHPEQGAHILQPIPAFGPLLPIVREHHERWDGAGYPSGLRGLAISQTARVLAVADVYDALRSDRPYRPGLSHDHVVAAIVGARGTHFDPSAIDGFLQIASEVHVIGPYDGASVMAVAAIGRAAS